MDDTATPVLELQGIQKNFGHVVALRGVDLQVFPGEVVALVGDNGAGKSTVVKVVSGAYTPDAGSVRVAGSVTRFRSPHDATTAGISTVYQDLALAENLDVVGNLFLGRERRRGFALDEEAMERETLGVLHRLGATIRDPRAVVSSLSGGQRQTCAIARSILGTAQLVQLDEPTAALGITQTSQVLDLIRRLRMEGVAILLISHNLAEVFAIVDRIVVLRLGQVAGDFTPDATPNEVVAAITGADAQAQAMGAGDVGKS